MNKMTSKQIINTCTVWQSARTSRNLRTDLRSRSVEFESLTRFPPRSLNRTPSIEHSRKIITFSVKVPYSILKYLERTSLHVASFNSNNSGKQIWATWTLEGPAQPSSSLEAPYNICSLIFAPTFKLCIKQELGDNIG